MSIYSKAAIAAAAACCIAAVAPASAAVTLNDRLTTSGTKDIFFQFTGGAFSVQVDGAADNGIADPEIYLFRDNGSMSGALTGAQVAHNDDIANPTNLNALISRTDLAAGNYVLSVGTFDFTAAEARSGVADFTAMQRRFVATFSNGVTITDGVAAVPEPATWAMMLVGFGLVAGAARYRRRKTLVTFA